MATDFSPSSDKAVAWAFALADQCGSAVTVFHVVDVNAQARGFESGVAGDLMGRLWGEASAGMDRLALPMGGDITARTEVEEGLPWESIVEKSRDFDLVILGNGGGKRTAKFFSRRTAQRVAENAPCPVLIVR